MAASWVFNITILMVVIAYLGGGGAIRRARGDPDGIPNPEFWSYVGGLVYDGVALVVSGGVTKGVGGYNDLNDAANAVATESSPAAGHSAPQADEGTASLLGNQASRKYTSNLHRNFSTHTSLRDCVCDDRWHAKFAALGGVARRFGKAHEAPGRQRAGD